MNDLTIVLRRASRLAFAMSGVVHVVEHPDHMAFIAAHLPEVGEKERTDHRLIESMRKRRAARADDDFVSIYAVFGDGSWIRVINHPDAISVARGNAA